MTPPSSDAQRSGHSRTSATPRTTVAPQASVRFASIHASPGSIAQSIDAAVTAIRTASSPRVSAPWGAARVTAEQQRGRGRDPGERLEDDLDRRQRAELQAALSLERDRREQRGERDRGQGRGVDPGQRDAPRERPRVSRGGVRGHGSGPPAPAAESAQAASTARRTIIGVGSSRELSATCRTAPGCEQLAADPDGLGAGARGVLHGALLGGRRAGGLGGLVARLTAAAGVAAARAGAVRAPAARAADGAGRAAATAPAVGAVWFERRSLSAARRARLMTSRQPVYWSESAGS